jgi:hypothetical protein
MAKSSGSYKIGHIPWSKNKKFTTMTRKKMSENHSHYWKGKCKSEELKRKISETMKRLINEGKKIMPQSKEDYVPWNKNKKCPQLSGKNNPNYGNHPVPWNKGKTNIYSEETKQKISRKGKKHSVETKLKMSEQRKADKNANWRGGIGRLPYAYEFNTQLKEQIRQRDGYRCQQCFRHQNELKDKLSVHHIDFNKKNNNPTNLISLCRNCHSQTNFSREDWSNYFNNLLRTGGKI